MYIYKYSERFKEVLVKLSKRDINLYERVLKKVEEIINSYDVGHYKNLRYDMKDYKRVQIGHFVLVFIFDKKNNMVSFEDFNHHDIVYKKKF